MPTNTEFATLEVRKDHVEDLLFLMTFFLVLAVRKYIGFTYDAKETFEAFNIAVKRLEDIGLELDNAD